MTTPRPTPSAAWLLPCALLLGAGIGIAVLLPSIKGTPVEIGAPIWDVLTSLGTLAAAAAAAYAAHKAVAIDGRVAERARDRERRDAIPLAYALHFELRRVAGLLSAAAQQITRSPDATGTLRGIRQTARQFEVTILKDAVTSLGCFDAETGKALGMALAVAEHYTSLCNWPEMDRPNPDFDQTAIRTLFAKAVDYEPILQSAVEHLHRYIQDAA
jgi:hypothetical protein